MTLQLFAQAGLAGMVGSYAIVAVVIAGIVGLLYVGLQQAGVAIPPAIARCLWIVAVVVLVVLAIKFLLSAL